MKKEKVKKEKKNRIKGFFTEFKEFISRGNIMTMAVGIIIGGAFNAIVSSLVKDIIMPPVSLLLGDEVSQLKWILQPEVLGVDGEILQNEIAMTWGVFVQAIINFLLVAFALFLMIKVMNSFHKQAELLKQQLMSDEEKKALEEAAAAEEARSAEEAAKAAEEAARPSEEVVLLREIVAQLKSKK